MAFETWTQTPLSHSTALLRKLVKGFTASLHSSTATDLGRKSGQHGHLRREGRGHGSERTEHSGKSTRPVGLEQVCFQSRDPVARSVVPTTCRPSDQGWTWWGICLQALSERKWEGMEDSGEATSLDPTADCSRAPSKAISSVVAKRSAWGRVSRGL